MLETLPTKFLLFLAIFACGNCATVGNISPHHKKGGVSASQLVGTQAPVSNIKSLYKDKFKISDRVGKTPTILAFLASKNLNSNDIIPELNKLEQRFLPAGLSVLGVFTQSSKASTTSVYRSKGVNFHAFLDRNGHLANRFGVETYPTLFWISKDGTIKSVTNNVPDILPGILDAN